MSKKISLILIILGIVFTIVGVTISYYIWSSSSEDNTLITFTVSSGFSCSVDGGGNITSGDVNLIPTEVNDSTIGNYIKREVKVYPQTVSGVTIYMDLWLTINSIDSGLSNSTNFMYAFTTGSTSPDDGVVASGNFNGTSAGSKLILIKNNEYSSALEEIYYLWIWLDADESSADTMNQSFSLSLGGICSENVNIVVDIPDGLIPVVLSDDGTVKNILTDDDNWYNYLEKRWANAVLVKESGTNTREYYQTNTGVVIPEDDILAYFVYVPRYKYKIWTTELSSVGNEQEIEIIFETKDTVKSTGNAAYEYLTHPAFTFGTDELNGIWVGKFETTGSATSPTIKPNAVSLRSQNVSSQFNSSKIFESSTYGLSTIVDVHMAKNSEWGAVAYLSHSKYGRCTDGVCEEIKRNNNDYYYTGYSAINDATTGYSETSISTNEYGVDNDITQPYNTVVGYLASTTGNISGVYDISGGTWERVMGVLHDGNGSIRRGSSGFTVSTIPDSKYYDLYTSTSSLTACSGGVCYGHALSETTEWYNDYIDFVSSSSPWFYRGGHFYDGINAGTFGSHIDNGSSNHDIGFRTILVVDNN